MEVVSWGLIIGISIGLAIGLLLAAAAFFCLRFHRPRAQIRNSSSRRASTIPICANGDNSCTLSDSTAGQDSPKLSDANGAPHWLDRSKRKSLISMSGIPSYCYKDLQKATKNFTTIIGEGAFGTVYKAKMPTGEVVAVKILSRKSKDGAKEFQSEVLLLGRLHHRNLVNLVGYCTEKSQHILIYVYMSNGNLASRLYGTNLETLSWNLRISIALDIARGLEYLHDGAIPPIVHRDIKSSNILLDQSMRARVADFGLSREENITPHVSNIRGTFGYLDPEYVSTKAFTKKSDIYSFGVLLFEVIAGRSPQQGLMEYVELAAINAEGKSGWEELVDSRLDGEYNTEELNDVAALAYKCVNKSGLERPSMREIVQALSNIHMGQQINTSFQEKPSSVRYEEVKSSELAPAHVQISISDLHTEDSTSNMSNSPEV